MPKGIPVLSESDERLPADESVGALPFQSLTVANLVTTSISDERLRSEIVSICESLSPSSIDPDNKLGVDEVELSLVVSGDAGVKLLGELRGGAKASINVTLRRQPS